MPADYNGCWKMISNENFDKYLKALDINVAIRKIATMMKPDKDITQDGNHFIIKTLSSFKNYSIDFVIGQEFEEDFTGLDNRKCKTTITWDREKLVCVQKGEIEGRGWTHWIDGEELHLISVNFLSELGCVEHPIYVFGLSSPKELTAAGVVSKQVFKKA